MPITRTPSLHDVYLVEKPAHFNWGRIPELKVHAKGAGAHGNFQVCKSIAAYTWEFPDSRC